MLKNANERLDELNKESEWLIVRIEELHKQLDEITTKRQKALSEYLQQVRKV